jgi:hypothetical protein
VTPPRSADSTPPPILGFAFYLLGTGCVALGLAALGIFAGNVHAIDAAPLPAWAFLIGQGMVLLGLAVAWRASRGASRRMLGVAATLWLTLLVVDVQQGRFTAYVAALASSRIPFASTTSSLVGRAIVLLVVAVAAHATGRAFASRTSRTWMTTLGATLVFADAWAGAWPVVTRASFGHSALRLVYTTPTMIGGGAGWFLAGGGLYLVGRATLRGGERAPATSSVASISYVRLYVEATIAVAGLAFVHAVSVAISTHVGLSTHDVSDTSTLGGEIVAWAAMVVALRGMRPFTRSALGFALAVLGVLGLEALLRYVVWSRGALSPSSAAMYAVTFLQVVGGVGVLLALRALRGAAAAVRAWAAEDGAAFESARLVLAANLVGVSLVASFFAPDLGTGTAFVAVEAIAVVSAATALALASGASSAPPRE